MDGDYECPGCGQKLQIRAEYAGQRRRCPGCGTIYEAPSAGGQARAIPDLQGRSSEGTGSPMPAGVNPLRPGNWRAVRRGVWFILGATIIVLFGVAYSFLVVFGELGMGDQSRRAAGTLGKTGSFDPYWAALQFVLVCLPAILGLAITAWGRCWCCFTPASFHGRWLATLSALLTVINVPLFVLSLLPLLAIFGPLDPILGVVVMLTWLAMLVSGFLAEVLFLIFLTVLAFALRAAGLRQRLRDFVLAVVGSLLFLGALLIGLAFLAARADPDGVVRAPGRLGLHLGTFNLGAGLTTAFAISLLVTLCYARVLSAATAALKEADRDRP
jgi:hypothetical protein